MAENPETLEPDPKWKDDPYRGVDVTMMQERLRMTPEERLRVAVADSNTLRRFVAALRRK